jgi:hypothetical protein
MKLVRLSALRTGRLYCPGNIPGTHFCQRLNRPQGHSAAGKITSMKNYKQKGFASILSHLRLHLPVSPFLHVSSPKPSIYFYSPYTCYMLRPSHCPLFHHPINIPCAVQIIKLPITQFFLTPSHSLPPTIKYRPQHPVFEHLQIMFFPQCDRPSATPIQNKRQNYSSVYLNLCILRQQTCQRIKLKTENSLPCLWNVYSLWLAVQNM